MLTVSGGQIWNHQFFPGQDTKPAYKQCNIKENHNLKRKLAQNLYDENVWHVNITQPIELGSSCTSQLFYKLFCTRPWAQLCGSRVDHQRKMHCWWSLFTDKIDQCEVITNVSHAIYTLIWALFSWSGWYRSCHLPHHGRSKNKCGAPTNTLLYIITLPMC